MNWNNSIFVLLCLTTMGCKDISKEVIPKVNARDMVVPIEKRSQYLIEADELVQKMDSENVKIIDFRKTEAYENGHIPNAIHMWRSDIEDHSFPYGGMMATKQTIEKLFSKLGISNEDLLIIYDDNGSCDATRLWWVLQNYDFDSVKILNGGLKSWKESGGVQNNEIPVFETSLFKLPENPSNKYLISKEAIADQLNKRSKVIILDTRTLDEYSGKRQKKGAFDGGRIPESQCIDWAEAIDYNGSHKFKSTEELNGIYNRLKVAKDHPIITYCHSGVRSAHTTFVLTQLLGYTNVKNYDGSWTEWSHFEAYPKIKDSITTILQ